MGHSRVSCFFAESTTANLGKSQEFPKQIRIAKQAKKNVLNGNFHLRLKLRFSRFPPFIARAASTKTSYYYFFNGTHNNGMKLKSWGFSLWMFNVEKPSYVGVFFCAHSQHNWFTPCDNLKLKARAWTRSVIEWKIQWWCNFTMRTCLNPSKAVYSGWIRFSRILQHPSWQHRAVQIDILSSMNGSKLTKINRLCRFNVNSSHLTFPSQSSQCQFALDVKFYINSSAATHRMTWMCVHTSKLHYSTTQTSRLMMRATITLSSVGIGCAMAERIVSSCHLVILSPSSSILWSWADSLSVKYLHIFK